MGTGTIRKGSSEQEECGVAIWNTRAGVLIQELAAKILCYILEGKTVGMSPTQRVNLWCCGGKDISDSGHVDDGGSGMDTF